MSRLMSVFVLLLAASLGSAAFAQDGESAAPAPYQVDVAELKIRLMPMPLDDVQVAAAEWMGHLQIMCSELARNELARNELAAQGSGDPDADARVVELHNQRTALIERVNLVLDEVSAKGGDPTGERAYVSAVSGVRIDVTDTNAMTDMARAWLTSSEGGVKWLLRIALFLAILIGFRIAAAIASGVLRRALTKFGETSELLRNFLVGMTKKTINFIGLIVGLSALGVPMGPFLAAMGAAGLVIGLALQGTLSNFASGIMILFYRPFDVGHFVSVGGSSGTVKSMTLVSTTLTTPDNQTIVVPNNAVWGGTITNVTGNDTRRVDLVFGIGYGDDIETARGILDRILASHELVMKDPEWTIQVSELADSSVNFICRPWVKTADYWTVFFDVTTTVKKQFDDEGVSIPFPQQDVHMHNT